jgi:hypothetical protein
MGFVAGKRTTALSIIGKVLGSIRVAGNGVGGLLNNNNVCHENMPVSRYEQGLESKIAKLESEVALRDSNIFTDSKILELYKYVDGKFASVERELADQRVYNATNIASVNCIANQVNQLYALTKLVIPNTSICPGWGNVTVSPATTTAG